MSSITADAVSRGLKLEVLTFMNEHWLPVFLFAMDLTRMREITFLFSSPVVFDQMVRVLSSRLSLSELWELQSVVFVIGVAQPDRVEDYTADLELIREITPHLHAAGSLVLRVCPRESGAPS